MIKKKAILFSVCASILVIFSTNISYGSTRTIGSQIVDLPKEYTGITNIALPPLPPQKNINNLEFILLRGSLLTPDDTKSLFFREMPTEFAEHKSLFTQAKKDYVRSASVLMQSIPTSPLEPISIVSKAYTNVYAIICVAFGITLGLLTPKLLKRLLPKKENFIKNNRFLIVLIVATIIYLSMVDIDPFKVVPRELYIDNATDKNWILKFDSAAPVISLKLTHRMIKIPDGTHKLTLSEQDSQISKENYLLEIRDTINEPGFMIFNIKARNEYIVKTDYYYSEKNSKQK